jgi:hypothetical protein
MKDLAKIMDILAKLNIKAVMLSVTTKTSSSPISFIQFKVEKSKKIEIIESIKDKNPKANIGIMQNLECVVTMSEHNTSYICRYYSYNMRIATTIPPEVYNDEPLEEFQQY